MKLNLPNLKFPPRGAMRAGFGRRAAGLRRDQLKLCANDGAFYRTMALPGGHDGR